MARTFSHAHDPSVPAFPHAGPCCVMDAHCSLCARGARWIAHNDKDQTFIIIPMQSILGAALLVHYDMDPKDPVSWLYLAEGKSYSSLQAVIKVGQELGGIWKLLGALNILPQGFQNWIYGIVARNRYRIFGKTNLCKTTDPLVKTRLYSDPQQG